MEIQQIYQQTDLSRVGFKEKVKILIILSHIQINYRQFCYFWILVLYDHRGMSDQNT